MSSQLVPVSSDPAPSNDVSSAHVGLDWRTVNAALLRMANSAASSMPRRKLAGWSQPENLHVYRHRGCVTVLVERVLGYGPRVAVDRLRVSKALQDLPATKAAMAAGSIPYSGVRELTRVAVPATETAWLDAAVGKTVRRIEGMVAGRRPGDTPDCEALISRSSSA